MQQRSLDGRAALVTGAASGMGRATAELFAAMGATVAVTDLDQNACDEVAAAIAAEGGTAKGWAMDVADSAAIDRVVEEAARHFGRLDIVVNNAGLARSVLLDDPAYDEAWSLSLDVLLTAHQRVVRAALAHLRASDAGRIVNIASTEGLGATPGNGPYVAAKHGVIGLTRSMAVDLGRDGITVNCICPGPIDTPLTAGIPDADKATFARRRTALRRYGRPDEVAHITASCVLPAASYLTGAVIPVDGGLSIRNA